MVKKQKIKGKQAADNILNIALNDDGGQVTTYRVRLLLSEYLSQQRCKQLYKEPVEHTTKKRKRCEDAEEEFDQAILETVVPIEGEVNVSTTSVKVDPEALFGTAYIRTDIERRCPGRLCRSRDIDDVVASIRSLDEPAVTLYRCNKCKRQWRH